MGLIQLWEKEVGCHYAVDAGGNHLPKRREFKIRQSLRAMGKDRKVEMRVAARVSVAWKVLGTTQHPSSAESALKCSSKCSGRGGIFSPSPHIDHRVSGVVVHVANGPEHPVQSAAARLVSGATAVALGEVQGSLRLVLIQPA